MKIGPKVRGLSNFIYYTLCLSAFVWQSTLISINFFQYHTVSSLDYKMPGKEKVKPLTLCFKSFEMYKAKMFESLFYRKLFPIFKQPINMSRSNDRKVAVEMGFTVRDRFDFSLTFDDLFSSGVIPLAKYILGNYICYQFKSDEDENYDWTGDISEKVDDAMRRYLLLPNVTENVTEFRLAASSEETLPHFEFFTTKVIKFPPGNIRIYLYTSSKILQIC